MLPQARVPNASHPGRQRVGTKPSSEGLEGAQARVPASPSQEEGGGSVDAY